MTEAATVTTESTSANKSVKLDGEGQKLFETYNQVTLNLKKVKKAEEVLTTQKNATVKALFDRHGKGPYPTPEGDMIIVSRGETFFFKTAYKKDAPAAG